MRFNLLNIIAGFSLLMIMASCTSAKKMVYLNDTKEDSTINSSSEEVFESPIQINDVLSIMVGGYNQEDLNKINSAGGGGMMGGGNMNSMNMMGGAGGYLVDSDGNIKVTFLGKVKAAGLTRKELEDTLQRKLSEYTLDPVVNVRFNNYRFTVMGEVKSPGTLTVPTERVTIIEAIGMAGDITVQGKRENVLVIREENGERKIGRVNLLSKDLFNSPYFYIQRNDVVYIEPAPAQFFARERLPQFIGVVGGTLSILALVLSLTK